MTGQPRDPWRRQARSKTLTFPTRINEWSEGLSKHAVSRGDSDSSQSRLGHTHFHSSNMPYIRAIEETLVAASFGVGFELPHSEQDVHPDPIGKHRSKTGDDVAPHVGLRIDEVYDHDYDPRAAREAKIKRANLNFGLNPFVTSANLFASPFSEPPHFSVRADGKSIHGTLS